MSGCAVYASCISSSCLLVMSLMFTCSVDTPVARGVLLWLYSVFLDVASFCYCLRGCCVGVAVWFRTCTLVPAPACGLAAHIDKAGALIQFAYF